MQRVMLEMAWIAELLKFICAKKAIELADGKLEWAVAESAACALVDAIFFFSSRRRHTRFDCDWSSDVCSSDLGVIIGETSAGSPGEALTIALPKNWAMQLSVTRHAFPNGEEFAGKGIQPELRSEEHTSELQSQSNLVCRLLLEKKNNS